MVADIAETVLSKLLLQITAPTVKTWVHFSANAVSTSDTITIDELSSILTATLKKKADGVAVTCTVATNVITVTGAITTVDLIGEAYGTGV